MSEAIELLIEALEQEMEELGYYCKITREGSSYACRLYSITNGELVDISTCYTKLAGIEGALDLAKQGDFDEV